jgi:hypothetical protein
VHEDILATLLWLDEAVSFLRVEPFDCANSHAPASSLSPYVSVWWRDSIAEFSGGCQSASKYKMAQNGNIFVFILILLLILLVVVAFDKDDKR